MMASRTSSSVHGRNSLKDVEQVEESVTGAADFVFSLSFNTLSMKKAERLAAETVLPSDDTRFEASFIYILFTVDQSFLPFAPSPRILDVL